MGGGEGSPRRVAELLPLRPSEEETLVGARAHKGGVGSEKTKDEK